MAVKINQLYSDTHIPACAGRNVSTIDLFAYLPAPVLLYPGGRHLIPTGIAIELPSGVAAQLRPQRSLAINCGVTILDAPAMITEFDQDEILVLLVNLGDRGVVIHPKMAIAQLIIVPAYQPPLAVMTEVVPTFRDAAPALNSRLR